MTVRRAFLRFFQIMAIAEAVTWFGLLVGMLFKHVLASDRFGVQFFGTFHGYACLGYVLSVFLVRREVRWSNRTTLIALAVAVPPFATLPFERWAIRHVNALPPEDGPPPAPSAASDPA